MEKKKEESASGREVQVLSSGAGGGHGRLFLGVAEIS